MNNKKKGISLIVLVITIIVIVILAGAVILTFSENNPINAANEAVFKSDLDAAESDLSLYLANEYTSTTSFNPDNLNADDLTAEYNGVEMPGKTIKDIIPVLSSTTKYDGQFEVVNGRLVYIGTDRTKKKWAQEVNIDVIDADRLDGIITTLVTLPVSPGTNVIATIKISSNASINKINLTGNLELLDINNVAVPVQPVFEIGTPSGNETDTLRNVEVTIKTNTLAEGTYKLKLKAGAISNIYDVTNETDIVTGELFEIDNTPPTNPGMLASPTGWTNSDVTVTITYPSDSVTKEYSIDGENWSTYTAPVTVTTNNTTVYSRALDIAGNQSGQSTMTISNIDREPPTVVYGTNGGNNLQVASTKVTVTDIGVSNVNITSLKYIWDTQNIDEPTDQWNAFSNDEVIHKANSNGTYYLWIKASDNTGNSIVTKSNAFVVDNIVPVNPIMSANPSTWTNGDVTVTITYPLDAAIKEYSTDTLTWNVYTVPVVITTNNTTVYSRAKDSSGNQSEQSSMTVANIDKVTPTIVATYKKADGTAYISDSWTNQSVTITGVGNDGTGSGIANYQITYNGSDFYDLPNGTVTLTTSGRTGVWVRARDNVGNVGNLSTSHIVSIDKTDPIITLSQTATKEYSKVITTNIYDTESGISVKKWAKGVQSVSYFTGNGTVFTGTTFNVSENDTYTVYTKNNAGTEKIETIVVTNVLFLKTYIGNSGLFYANGATCDANGVITLPVASGSTPVQYGPYQNLEAGNYQITITGENLNQGQLLTYHGYGTPQPGVTVNRTIVTSNSTTCIYTINLAEFTATYESVIYNYSSYIIKVNSIEIKQIL